MRSRRSRLQALGVGAVAGVLVGEGVYGLAFIADTTYPPYWWVEIGAGVLVVAAAAIRRLRPPSDIALCVLTAAVVAAAFVAVYSQELIGLL